MDGAELTPPANMGVPSSSSSRPTLGFPVGTALLLIVIFCLSAVFSCCYHWERLRSLRRRHRPPLPEESPPSKLAPQPQNLIQEKDQSLPVIMPGDQIPKFMAWPCPCKQPLSNIEKIMVEVVVGPSTTINHSPLQPIT